VNADDREGKGPADRAAVGDDPALVVYSSFSDRSRRAETRWMNTDIYYDGDCPFCRHYVSLLRLRNAASGDVRLISLREAPEACRRFQSLGIDPDQGMVVEQNGRLYHGSEAVHRLALMTTPSGLFNRISAAVFSIPFLAALLYPLMRLVRNSVLLLMGRTPLRQADLGEQALFQIFSRFFGLFAVLHVLIYVFRYVPGGFHVSMPVIVACGLALVVRPGSVRFFVILFLAMLLEAWMQAPLASNHTILKNFWLFALLLGGCYASLRGLSFDTFFRQVRPVGQALLVVMYFFGVFHKLNTGFLDPEVSCAVELWRAMPRFLATLDSAWFHYVAIYGTFIIEAAIVFALLLPRIRHLGIIAGIGFHGLLALSGYAMYAVFSTLTICLHLLFLSPDGARRVVSSPLWQAIDRGLRRPLYLMLLGLALGLMSLAAWNQQFIHVTYLWLLIVAPWLAAVAVYGRGEYRQPILWSSWHWLNVVSLAFLLNGAMPYLGLKTAQTLNMFSNLRLEGGVSNHVILSRPPGPFDYLEDLVDVSRADPRLKLDFFVRRDDSLLVYYDLLNRMEREPEARVSYMRGGVRYDNVNFADVSEDAGRLLHSRAFRKYFHFRWVRNSGKVTCDSSPPWGWEEKQKLPASGRG
jgi:predicted DCC family thiol-disulfide oxidoreductase YuxK